MTFIPPVSPQPLNPAVKPQGQFNSTNLVNTINDEIAIQQKELKCRILADLLEADDVSIREKQVIQGMYNEAKQDFEACKRRLNVS